MAFDIKNFVKQTITAGGTGVITLGSAVSGFAALGAANDGVWFPHTLQDGTAWECGLGYYTHSGTTFTRFFISESSNAGSPINVTTAGFFFIDLNSLIAGNAYTGAAYGVTPGGRLTLTSGLPVTTADVTAATSIYYTSYLSGTVGLYGGLIGNIWYCYNFSETSGELSLALGTVTSGLPYDVFCYANAGVPTLEKLAWTNGTTRATGISLQDGRYCKADDKTRLYLGTIFTTSTTTTEDSELNRLVWNMYNRVDRVLNQSDTTASWTYTTATWRSQNNSTGNRVGVVVGLAGVSAIDLSNYIVVGATPTTGAIDVALGIGENSTSTPSTYNKGRDFVTHYRSAFGTVTLDCSPSSRLVKTAPLGYNYYQQIEYSGASGTTTWYGNDAGNEPNKTGMVGTVSA